METEELKALWNKYDLKLEKSMSLNLKLLKEMKLEKTKNSLNKFTVLKAISLAFQFAVIYFLMNLLLDIYQNIGLAVQVGILLALTYVAFIWNIYQLATVLMIKYSEPVVLIQKKIELLKIQKLRYNKFLFIASYPYVMLMLFSILHFNLAAINYFPIMWLVPNIALAILWIPLGFWLIKKYNSTNANSSFWRKLSGESSLTPGSASKTLNNSLGFLAEIREFENSGVRNLQ